MTLEVNFVSTVPSVKFICCCWRNPWCYCNVTHAPKYNEPAKIRSNYWDSTVLIVSLFCLCRFRTTVWHSLDLAC